eukprot:GFUD01133510.1.p2 GENE.GFUD01133510.1~~GFUD01133510.1.p2  ORF type:complete len:104 (-),score=21.76 GFUD01133510.1:30-341(-)
MMNIYHVKENVRKKTKSFVISKVIQERLRTHMPGALGCITSGLAVMIQGKMTKPVEMVMTEASYVKIHTILETGFSFQTHVDTLLAGKQLKKSLEGKKDLFGM